MFWVDSITRDHKDIMINIILGGGALAPWLHSHWLSVFKVERIYTWHFVTTKVTTVQQVGGRRVVHIMIRLVVHIPRTGVAHGSLQDTSRLLVVTTTQERFKCTNITTTSLNSRRPCWPVIHQDILILLIHWFRIIRCSISTADCTALYKRHTDMISHLMVVATRVTVASVWRCRVRWVTCLAILPRLAKVLHIRLGYTCGSLHAGHDRIIDGFYTIRVSPLP